MLLRFVIFIIPLILSNHIKYTGFLKVLHPFICCLMLARIAAVFLQACLEFQSSAGRSISVVLGSTIVRLQYFETYSNLTQNLSKGSQRFHSSWLASWRFCCGLICDSSYFEVLNLPSLGIGEPILAGSKLLSDPSLPENYFPFPWDGHFQLGLMVPSSSSVIRESNPDHTRACISTPFLPLSLVASDHDSQWILLQTWTLQAAFDWSQV